MAEYTKMELEVIEAFVNESVEDCGQFNEDCNTSYANANDISNATGLNLQQVGAIFSNLIKKEALIDTGESYRELNINDFILVDYSFSR